MFKNYVKAAFRNLRRNPFFSIINIVCLSIGLTGILLSYLLIFQEFNIVKKHDNYENIYQLENKFYFDNSERTSAGTSGPQAPYLKEHFPEVLKYARIGIPRISEIKSERKENVQQPARYKLACADKDIFNIFSFSFIYGSSNNALDDPNSVILTEETSKKFFGNENPVGNVLLVNRNYQVTVTGVVKDLQIDTKLDFDYLLPFDFLEKTGENIITYTNNNFRSYVLVDEKVNISELNEKIINTFTLPSEKVGVRIETSIASISKSEIGEVIYIIAILSVALLIISCLNFISLTTAQLTKRTQEISIRKIIGASRGHLIKQYLIETILTSLFALCVSFVILESVQPVLKQYLQLNVRMPYSNVEFISGLLLLTIVIGAIAGFYPAYISSLCNPINAFQSINRGKPKSRLRKVWIYLQLIPSVFFVLCITFLYKQFYFMHSSHRGISKENVFFSNVNTGDEYEAIKAKLSGLPFVAGISCASDIPTSVHNSATNWGLQGNLKNSLLSYSYVDYDFAKLFNLSVIKGEFFSEKFKSNSRKIVLNESAASYLGIENPVGETCYIQGEPFQIVGIVKNYNYQALKRNIAPLALILNASIGNYLFLKLNRNDYSSIKAIQKEIEIFIPGKTFEFSTLEDYLDEAAKFDLGVFRTALFLCCIGILISSLGLLALAIFFAAQRTKEIGIRKVLGGSIWNISFRYLKESLTVYFVAVTTSSMLAYFAMTKLLQQYPYRISLDLWEFLAIDSVIVLLLCLVVLIPYLKAATANPVESMRYE